MDPRIAIETPVGLPEPDYSDQEDDIPPTDSLSIPSDPDLNPSTVQVKDSCMEEVSMPDVVIPLVTSELDADMRDGGEIPVPDYSEEEDEDQIEADHNAKTALKIDVASPSSQSTNNQLTPSDDDGSGSGLISPKKLVNPCLVSKEHKALRQELMFNQKLGKNPTEKPELMKVLKERQEKEKKKEIEEHLKSKRTDFDIRLEEQAQKINQAEQLRHQELEQIKKEADKPEFFKVHSKIIKTKSDS